MDNDWYARICFIDPFQGTMLARYAVDAGYKNVAIIQEIESEYAVGLVNYFEQELATHEGFTVTSKGNFVNTDQDFTTLLTDAMQADGFTDFIEVGAGKTLSGLISKIGGAARIANVEDAETLNATVQLIRGETACKTLSCSRSWGIPENQS